MTIDRRTALSRTFAAAFAALDDSKDPLIVSQIWVVSFKDISEQIARSAP
jgi:hypothetical protein